MEYTLSEKKILRTPLENFFKVFPFLKLVLNIRFQNVSKCQYVIFLMAGFCFS